MATTPKTVKTYTLNGSLKDFTITFEYLARKFVSVTLIGATRKELVLNVDYRFSTPTTITTLRGSAWGPADNFQLIEIRRVTSATDRLVDFADGSILRAYDLNTAQVQSLHIAEEARDLTADTIGVNNDGNLDARARRIVNLADAIDVGDAVTLRQQQQWAATALNYSTASGVSAAASQTSRLASEAARDSAITANTNAQVATVRAEEWANKAYNVQVTTGKYSAYHYSEQARLNAVDAMAWAGSASTSASTATTQASLATSNGAAQVALAAAQVTLATTQATNSASSATASAGSATNSLNSSNLSADWASKAEDSVVSGGLYSSRHYSLKAAASAASAASWAASVNLPSISGKANQALVANSAGNAIIYVPRSVQYCFQVKGGAAAVGLNATYLPTGGTVILNNGLVYSNATGKFTAPVNGIYRFNLSMTRGGSTNGVNQSPEIGISVNGAPTVFSLCYGNAGGAPNDYTSSSVELMIELTAGAEVTPYFKNVNGSAVGLYNYSFCGQIL